MDITGVSEVKRAPLTLEAIRHDYSISGWVNIDGRLVIRRVGLTELVREYNRIGEPIPAHLERLNERGERYSNESFDALSAAMSAVYKSDSNIWHRIGRPERGTVSR